MPCSLPRQYLNQFLISVRDFYRQESNSKFELFVDMAEFLDVLINDTSRTYPGLGNKSLLPAISHLPIAVADAGEQTKKIAGAINQLAPFLNWQQTSGYEILGEYYLNNYGYCTLIGPGLLIEHPTMKLGFGLWGPDLHYPLHHHAAEECYHVLGNEMQFRRKNEQWMTYYDGDAIYNPPWQVHELRAVGKPMFLLYTWRGDVTPDAILV